MTGIAQLDVTLPGFADPLFTGGLILIPLLGGGMFLLGDTPLSFLLLLLFVLRHWLVSQRDCPLIGVSVTSGAEES